jgi:signal-transduction protein with cAMP-binding, CBS, and nucleotidyltransferase domain
MKVTPDTLFSLKLIPLFENLSNPEIIAIASVTIKKSYGPNSVVFEKGDFPQCLQIITDGKFEVVDEEHGTSACLSENVFGIRELLFDLPIEQKILASRSHGAECFLIRKSNFFTIIHECPNLLLNYLSRQRSHAVSRVEGSQK